jgi:F-type H+-transporting ATPase subunit gamma
VRAYPGGRLKAIKRRAKTVKTIGKITGTMKVVASSKLTAAQAKAKSVSPFFVSLKKAFEKVKPTPTSKILMLVICTDKGLCGATNNALTRNLLKEDLSNTSVVLWGDKGCGAFERSAKYKNNVIFSVHPSQKFPLSYLEISTVAEKLGTLDYDFIRLVFNRMHTSSSPQVDNLYLPSFKTLEANKSSFANYDQEVNNTDEMFHNLAEFYITSAITYACFHNQAVETFARRNSMDNASKNAKKVGQKLTLKYNRERQAIITTELGEITSGAAAVAEGSKN